MERKGSNISYVIMNKFYTHTHTHTHTHFFLPGRAAAMDVHWVGIGCDGKEGAVASVI